ncbi:MAG: hypothetical protein WB819_20660 [Terriglobia bacterium]
MTQWGSVKGHDFSRAGGAPEKLLAGLQPLSGTLMAPGLSAAEAAGFEPPLRVD